MTISTPDKSSSTHADAPISDSAGTDAAAVEAHFQETLAHQREKAEILKRKRLNFTVIRFIATWLFFVGILVVFGLLTHLEWARPKIQQSMSETFHRKVLLGDLSWVLGLNGLAISTDKLAMIEPNGKPFIVSGHSEIGVAFLPLFQKRVLVKHIEFHGPQVFATQVAPGKWNFSDLLVEGPEIRFVQVEKGSLHLRNEITEAQLAQPHPETIFANRNWAAYDFENVDVKLIFPRKRQKRPWPFYLAFQLPREIGGKKYTTDFSLTILGQGQFDEWQRNKSDIEFRVENLNPADWRPFMRLPNGLKGLVSVKFKGQGAVEKAIAGDITYSAQDVSVVTDSQSLFTAQTVRGTAKASFGPEALTWDKAQIDIGGVKLDSRGEIFGWQTATPRYAARIAADLRNLAQLSDTSLWRFFPGAKKDKDLSGAAVVEVAFEGEGDQQRVFTSLKAENIPLANLLASNDTANGASLLSLFQIERNAPIKGRIEIGHDQRILLKDVEIPAKGSKLKIRGFIDAPKQQHEVYIEAAGLPLDNFDTAELGGVGGSKRPGAKLALSGKVDFQAKLTADKRTNQTDVKASLKQSSLTGGNTVLAKDLAGNIRFDGTTISFDNIRGVLANGGVRGGSLLLRGNLQTTRKGTCMLEVSGHHVDIEQLVGFARAAHLPLPAKAVDDVKGIARDLDIQIAGKADSPNLTLNISPEDIRYEFRPVKADRAQVKEMRALSGNITLADEVLQLRNVIVTAGQSKLIVNASFESHDKGIVPRLLHIKTAGVDISEFLKYANSETLPPDVRKQLAATFAALHLQDVDGKAYGDLTIRVANKGPNFIEGLVGLTSVSGKFGESATPFEGLGGILQFSGNDVSLQDMIASSGNGHFNFSGEVKSFQDAPVWTLNVGGKARGQDLAGFIPNQGGGRARFDLYSMAPLTVRGNFLGDSKAISGSFTLVSPSGNQLRMRSDAVTVQQPPGHGMTIDGSLGFNSVAGARTLDLRSWHIAVGDSVVQGSAKFAWVADSSKPPSVDFVVSTPHPVPADIMVGMFLPGVDATGSSGTLKGTLAAAGDVGDLLTHGELVFNKVTIPSLRIKDMEAKLDAPRWLIASSGASRQDKITSEAHFSVSQAILGNVDTRDLRTTWRLESGGGERRVTLKDGTGSVAGGKTTLNGYYLPDSGKWKLDIAIAKMQVDQFVTDLLEHSGEVTGLADGKILLASTADGELIQNLSGSGNIFLYKGSVPRLGQLHEKLQASNLIQQGIFGFNLNNVLHSIVPSKTGKFREISMDFIVDRGVVDIGRLTFDGTDLRLRAAGDWNIVKDTLDLDVAGDIPRVASSILPGAVGEATRSFTLQKAVRVVTFRKLENFPSLPIIGDIGTDDPRAFTFKIAANLDSPDAVTKSIEKSFKWLPNKPNASAHPVPGLD